MHRAARVEDWLHRRREALARKRGHQPTIVPYSGYGSTEWIRVLCRVLLAKPVSERASTRRRDGGIRGWRSFTSVPIDRAEVTVRVNGTEHVVHADRGGVVDAVIPVQLSPGRHEYTLQTPGSIEVSAPVHVVDPDARFGVVSDVDDTVMVTALPRPFVAAWNTFVLNEHARIPTPGMAVLLSWLAESRQHTPVIYLSTGAWNVAPTLSRFLSRNLYPAGPLLLTDWGPTHDRWFRSGRAHKSDNLKRLAAEFPKIKWLLIGDDGQHDEDIYRDFVEAHPDNVAAVAIRQLSPGEAVLAGGRSKIETSSHHQSAPWVYAPNGEGLAEQLTSLGVLKRD